MSLSKVFTDYRQWIYVNSKLVAQAEIIMKMLSYVIAGKMKSSAISEFLYSAINIIVILNDEILVSAMKKEQSEMIFVDQQWRPLRIFFTVVDNLSVFLELYATKIWGLKGKWIVLSILQFLKFLWRILILIQYNLGLDHCRPLSPLNRKQISSSTGSKSYLYLDENEMPGTHQESFALKTGRIIRTVEGSPDFLKRNWKPPTIKKGNNNRSSSKLQGISRLGEGIHIIKPVVHLYLMKRYGQRSFIPFICALTMDLLSLKLIQTDNLGNKEIQRRQMMLLMYLMRSPFYDHFSRDFFDTILTNLGKLPIVGYVPKHILQYIPYWQQLYSYIWD